MLRDKKLTEENVLALCQQAVFSLETFNSSLFCSKFILFWLKHRQTQRAEHFPAFFVFVLFYLFLIFCFVYFSVHFQAQPIPSELTAKLLGNRVAVSPIVTIEPRRRKFHKPITLTIPVPVAASKGMINQYNGETPTLRLLCSITGRFRGRLRLAIVLCDSVVYFTLGVVNDNINNINDINNINIISISI